MAENKLADLSIDFAVKVLKMTDGIKGHYSLTNQFNAQLFFALFEYSFDSIK